MMVTMLMNMQKKMMMLMIMTRKSMPVATSMMSAMTIAIVSIDDN